MAEPEEIKHMRAALGRDLSTRIEVERAMPERLVALLRQLRRTETSEGAARVDR
jgi:hypothetical protein